MAASGVVFNGGFSSPPDDLADRSSRGLLLTRIVAGVVMALVCGLGVVFILVWRHRHLKAMQKLTEVNVQQEMQLNVMAAEKAITSRETQVLTTVLGPGTMPEAMKRLQISPAEVRLLRPIGSGTFGDVFIANWSGTPCAVKRLKRERLTERGLMCFKDEISLHATLRHPNIVALLGCSVQPENGTVQAILELCSRGTLGHILTDKRAVVLTWSAHKLPIAIGIARAMSYLHAQEPPIIHRDLKPSNVLVDDGYNAKLADFGLSREEEEATMSSVGTPMVSAPEVLRRERYSKSADVWSFGCILETLDTHRTTYSWFVPYDRALNQVAEGKLTPKLPRLFADGAINSCVAVDAASRPRFEAVVEVLSSSRMGLAAHLQPPGPATVFEHAPDETEVGAEQPIITRAAFSTLPTFVPHAVVEDVAQCTWTSQDLTNIDPAKPWVCFQMSCAHLNPKPPSLVPAELLGPTSRLTVFGVFNSRELEIAYKENRYYRVARPARRVLVLVCLIVLLSLLVVAAAPIRSYQPSVLTADHLLNTRAWFMGVLLLTTVFTFTPWWGPATLQPLLFLLTLSTVLLFIATDVIFGSSIEYGCELAAEPVNASARICDAMCPSGLTAEQTYAGRTVFFMSQQTAISVSILFFVPIDALLVISLALVHAVLTEVVLQRGFDFGLGGVYIMHAILLTLLGVASITQSRAARLHFLITERHVATLDRRIEQLNAEKERVEWERRMLSKDRAENDNSGSATESPVESHENPTNSRDAKLNRTPSGTFRLRPGMMCNPASSRGQSSDKASSSGSKLGPLPDEWPLKRQKEGYPEDRPACYPSADPTSRRLTTRQRAKQLCRDSHRRASSAMRVNKARPPTHFPAPTPMPAASIARPQTPPPDSDPQPHTSPDDNFARPQTPTPAAGENEVLGNSGRPQTPLPISIHVV